MKATTRKRTKLITIGVVLAVISGFALVVMTGVFVVDFMFSIARFPCGLTPVNTRITDAYMAFDQKGEQRTEAFAQEDHSFYAHVFMRCAVAGATVKAALIAMDDENLALQVLTWTIPQEAITGRDSSLWFKFDPNDLLWSPGNYRIDISIDDREDESIEFRVE